MKKVIVEISDDPVFCDSGPGGKMCDYNPCKLDCNECGLVPSFILPVEKRLEYDESKARYRKCQWCRETFAGGEMKKVTVRVSEASNG